MATIRELFHNLGNKHNVVTLGGGATEAIVQECLETAGLPEALKDNLAEIQKNLQRIVKEAMNADKIATEIHDRVYQVVDPDAAKPL